MMVLFRCQIQLILKIQSKFYNFSVYILSSNSYNSGNIFLRLISNRYLNIYGVCTSSFQLEYISCNILFLIQSVVFLTIIIPNYKQLNMDRRALIQQEKYKIIIQGLTDHIKELTQCINENNQKYEQNMNTLKSFYQDQINELNNQILHQDHQQQQITMAKNMIQSLKDIIQNKNSQIIQLNSKISTLSEEKEEVQEKLRREKQRNQEVYKQMDELREKMVINVSKQCQKRKSAEALNSELKIQLKQRQSEIKLLKTKIESLQLKIHQNFRLPQKVKSLEIETIKTSENAVHLEEKVQELRREKDFMTLQLQKKRKENEKLVIQVNRSRGDLSAEIEKVLKKEREKFRQQLDSIKMLNEKRLYQIKDLQMKLKDKAAVADKLEKLVENVEVEKKKLLNSIKQLNQDKVIYLNQFRGLKNQYEEVINNLQNAVPEYQKKNWALQQQNQDLHMQLDGLQELLRELKSMNDMEPARKEYRHWAQLNLAADRKLPEQENRKFSNSPIKSGQRNFLQRENQTDISPDWDKLMLEIEKIKI